VVGRLGELKMEKQTGKPNINPCEEAMASMPALQPHQGFFIGRNI